MTYKPEIQEIRNLRKLAPAFGLSDCKTALSETEGDTKQALTYLVALDRVRDIKNGLSICRATWTAEGVDYSRLDYYMDLLT